MRCPEYLDDCAFSCEIGAVKPEAAIYDASLNELGLAPGETLSVGDGSDAELSGAARCGMRPVLIVVDLSNTYDARRAAWFCAQRRRFWSAAACRRFRAGWMLQQRLAGQAAAEWARWARQAVDGWVAPPAGAKAAASCRTPKRGFPPRKTIPHTPGRIGP